MSKFKSILLFVTMIFTDLAIEDCILGL